MRGRRRRTRRALACTLGLSLQRRSVCTPESTRCLLLGVNAPRSITLGPARLGVGLTAAAAAAASQCPGPPASWQYDAPAPRPPSRARRPEARNGDVGVLERRAGRKRRLARGRGGAAAAAATAAAAAAAGGAAGGGVMMPVVVPAKRRVCGQRIRPRADSQSTQHLGPASFWSFREQQYADNCDKRHFLNCNQHFGNMKPQQFPSAV